MIDHILFDIRMKNDIDRVSLGLDWRQYDHGEVYIVGISFHELLDHS